MHGGARGSGAPVGNRNALKHGMYTKASLEEQKALRKMIRQMKESLQEIEK
jgi:glucans biosynthesis protein